MSSECQKGGSLSLVCFLFSKVGQNRGSESHKITRGSNIRSQESGTRFSLKNCSRVVLFLLQEKTNPRSFGMFASARDEIKQKSTWEVPPQEDCGQGLSKSIAGNVFLSQKTWQLAPTLDCTRNKGFDELSSGLACLGTRGLAWGMELSQCEFPLAEVLVQQSLWKAIAAWILGRFVPVQNPYLCSRRHCQSCLSHALFGLP